MIGCYNRKVGRSTLYSKYSTQIRSWRQRFLSGILLGSMLLEDLVNDVIEVVGCFYYLLSQISHLEPMFSSMLA